VVWQFHAEDDTGMLSQFHDLARVLDVDDGGDPVAAVHTALAGHAERWLLILDNVTDYASMRRWIPPKGDGHVLVTTRDGHWPARQVLSVEALEVHAGATFLMDGTGSTDVASARAVSAELGGLPLALAQAAAYCQATGRTLADYRRLLRDDHVAMLARGAPAAHAAPVVATWSLAMERLEKVSPGAVTTLRIASHLAPDDIPFRLLLHPGVKLPKAGVDRCIVRQVRALCSGDVAADDAVAALCGHSLITLAGDTFGVHRLVQAVTRNQLSPSAQAGWKKMAAAMVEAAVPIDVEKRESWAACRLLLPHAQMAAYPLGKPMWRLARFLGASGDYATARAQWDTIVEANTACRGAEHRHTLAARRNLARWTGEAGDAVAARDLFAALLPIQEQVSGPEHPDTLAARAYLARWTGHAGDAVAARDLFAALLPIHGQVLGPEHPHTLATRANLASWAGAAGDAVAARDQYAALLPIWEKVSGPEHPNTLATRANLASWTGEAGDAVAARDQNAALLPIREKVLGPEHPATLTTRANLASWIGEAGDAVAARDQYAALLPIQERVLGPEHPATLTIRGSLAYWSQQAETL